MKEQEGAIFGVPEEAEKFSLRHPLWFERFPRLVAAINMAFARTQSTAEPADKFVYLYGRMCTEDFMEILLVCGNGYGAAGMKLLRSMYEHAVTLRYLHEHPDEIDMFMDYHQVQQFRLMKPILETFGKDALPPNIVAEVERKFAEVKDRFMITDCRKCGSKRLNHTWNKLDFVAMAKKTGPIGRQLVPGYFLPLRHAHTTFGGLSDRIEIAGERIGFQPESPPKMADDALMVAHSCLLNILDAQQERFNVPGLKEQLQICFRDFLEIWIPDSQALKETGSKP